MLRRFLAKWNWWPIFIVNIVLTLINVVSFTGFGIYYNIKVGWLREHHRPSAVETIWVIGNGKQTAERSSTTALSSARSPWSSTDLTSTLMCFQSSSSEKCTEFDLHTYMI